MTYGPFVWPGSPRFFLVILKGLLFIVQFIIDGTTNNASCFDSHSDGLGSPFSQVMSLEMKMKILIERWSFYFLPPITSKISSKSHVRSHSRACFALMFQRFVVATNLTAMSLEHLFLRVQGLQLQLAPVECQGRKVEVRKKKTPDMSSAMT